MAAKRFEYQHKDIPFLKKDIAYRSTFTALFILVFVWQFISIIMTQAKGTLTKLEIVLGSINMVFCMMFALVSVLYIMRSVKIIGQVKKVGKSVKLVTLFSVNKKDSFLRLYGAVTKIIALIMFLLLVSGVTYSILEYAHYSTISFYLPLLFTFALSGFNSVWHMTAEINLMRDVQEYNSIY